MNDKDKNITPNNFKALQGLGHVCLSLIFGPISHRFTRDCTNIDTKQTF